MQALPDLANCTIGVVGLGYVGLPLAVEFGRIHDTLGYDLDAARIEELRQGRDRNGETSTAELASASKLALASDPARLAACNVFIVTVPTPVDDANTPDLTALRHASRMIGGLLKRGDVVVYESTVYPGTTEEVCVVELERASELSCNRDFHVGYSPERINPGDPAHGLTRVTKVTSGSTPEAADFVDALYARIVAAGTHKAASIRVAEAAKVIENTQRDVNIALVNELAMMFHAMGIDTQDVLAAAGTKWNFLPFKPGLVGGHCIGVDPYYLTHKATLLGYHPELITAARRINSRMGVYVAHQVMREMARHRIHVVGARVLVLGLAFKEDCQDLRNTRVAEIVAELQAAGAQVDVHDPWADAEAARHELGIALVDAPAHAAYDAIVMAVAHSRFRKEVPAMLPAWRKPACIVYDVKGLLDPALVDGRL